jgi:tetratricopeptide (TPR) repeat protein
MRNFCLIVVLMISLSFQRNAWCVEHDEESLQAKSKFSKSSSFEELPDELLEKIFSLVNEDSPNEILKYQASKKLRRIIRSVFSDNSREIPWDLSAPESKKIFNILKTERFSKILDTLTESMNLKSNQLTMPYLPQPGAPNPFTLSMRRTQKSREVVAKATLRAPLPFESALVKFGYAAHSYLSGLVSAQARMEEALEQLRLEADGGSAAASDLLALCYINGIGVGADQHLAKDYSDKAIQLLRNQKNAQSKSADKIHYLDLKEKLARDPQNLELHQQAIESQFANLEDRRAAGIAYWDAQNFQRSAEVMDQILKEVNPPSAQDLRYAGYSHYGVKNFARSVELFEQLLLMAQPPSLNDLRAAGSANFKAGYYGRSIELQELILSTFQPSTVVDIRSAAYSYFWAGSFSRAAELLERVLKEAQPPIPQDLRNAGAAYYEIENYQRATELFEEVLKVANPPLIRDYRNAGVAHFSAKSYLKAADYFEKVLLDSKEPQLSALREAGMAQVNSKNFSRAIELFEQILKETNPPTQEDLENAWVAHYAAGNFERAEALKVQYLSSKVTQ